MQGCQSWLPLMLCLKTPDLHASSRSRYPPARRRPARPGGCAATGRVAAGAATMRRPGTAPHNVFHGRSSPSAMLKPLCAWVSVMCEARRELRGGHPHANSQPAQWSGAEMNALPYCKSRMRIMQTGIPDHHTRQSAPWSTSVTTKQPKETALTNDMPQTGSQTHAKGSRRGDASNLLKQ